MRPYFWAFIMSQTALVLLTAHQVHVEYQPKILQRHLRKTFVARDTGVVHQHIDAAPSLHDLLYHLLHLIDIGDIRTVCHRLTTGANNFFDDRQGILRWLAVLPQIIHHYFRTARRQAQSMTAPQACTRPGHYRNFVIK